MNPVFVLLCLDGDPLVVAGLVAVFVCHVPATENEKKENSVRQLEAVAKELKHITNR